MDSQEIKLSINDLEERLDEIENSVLNIEAKEIRLKEVENQLSQEETWSDLDLSQKLNKEKTSIDKTLESFRDVKNKLSDCSLLLQIANEDNDDSPLEEIIEDLIKIKSKIEEFEFNKMFSNKMDPNNAYLDIQSGSGGTEAQDWAEMLMRMYLKWGESKGFETEVIEVSPGEVAGIKSAAIKFNGDYAYGWLRTETGVHRLVRKSPFDSGSKRHTSFASIFISPEVDETVEIEINPADLRIDTYRASGAGGQHVNKTDSAIRITHEPSGVVSQCQSQRSQHQNKDKAMAQLRAKLYEIEMNKINEEKQSLEESKADIGWGSQIRSYVLDSSRIKDLRTGVETTNCSAVLDGGLDYFIEASLKENI